MAAWPERMTARERFNRQMNWKSVDRSFNMEFGYWDENFTEWSMFRDNGIKSIPEADVFFGFDKIEVISGNLWIYPPMEQKIIGEKGDRYLIRNNAGLIAEVPKDGHSTIPHYIKSSIETPEDWRRIKRDYFDPSAPGRLPDIAALKAKHGADDKRDYPLGIDCGSMIGRVRDMLTFEGLCYAVYDYPEMVEDMIETACELTEQALDLLLPEFQFDYASGWEDICFKNGPILSPKYFDAVIVPRYKRIRDKLDKFGIDLWYTDCDGDVRTILPQLMDGGINCLFPFEVACCAHPGELLDDYPGLRIMGGVDKIEIGKGRREIDAYLETLVPYVERGGYIPFIDHRCPPSVSQENYLYYLERKEALFGVLR